MTDMRSSASKFVGWHPLLYSFCSLFDNLSKVFVVFRPLVHQEVDSIVEGLLVLFLTRWFTSRDESRAVASLRRAKRFGKRDDPDNDGLKCFMPPSRLLVSTSNGLYYWADGRARILSFWWAGSSLWACFSVSVPRNLEFSSFSMFLSFSIASEAYLLEILVQLIFTPSLLRLKSG